MLNVTAQTGPIGGQTELGFPVGSSIQDVVNRVAAVGFIPVVWIRSTSDQAQWETVPPSMWRFVKPKGRNVLKLEMVPAGGENNQTFALIATIAVSILAPYTGGTLGTLFFGTGNAGLIAGAAFGTALALGGSIAINKLFPVNTAIPRKRSDEAQAAFEGVDTDINPLAKDVFPPIIHGHRRVTLPSACNPHRYLEDGVEVLEACLVATGYHSGTDIQIDGVDIDNVPGVEYQIRDGQEGAAQQTLINRVTKTKSINEGLGKFELDTGSVNLTDQTNPEISEPQPVFFNTGTHEDFSQFTVRMTFEPFINQANESNDIRVPIRITLRSKNDLTTDYNVPEIHLVTRRTTPIPKEFRFRWDSNFGVVNASADIAYNFYREVPATSDTLSNGATGTQWEAHSMFDDGAGLQDTVGIDADADGVNIQLDPTVLPPQDLEVEIRIGQPIKDADFTAATYLLDGTVRSLFYARQSSGNWRVPSGRDGIFGGANVDFMVKIANRKPVEAPGFWQMPIKFRGTSAKNVTIKMGAYVNDWGGSAWDDLSVTENPAPHARHILRSMMQGLGIDTTLIDDDEFLSWRTECETKGYTVGHVATGGRWIENLQRVMVAGMATPSAGDKYSVAWHRNRDNEVPEAVFSHRNAKIMVSRDFAYSPKGYTVKYGTDFPSNDEPEIQFDNKWRPTTLNTNNVTIDLPQIVDADHARRVAVLDALQDAYQQETWMIQAGPAAYYRQKGSMIGLVTDLYSDFAHGFVIREVTGDRSIALDRSVAAEDYEPLNEPSDLTVEEYLGIAGATSSISIQEPDGIATYTVANVSGNILTLTEDLPTSWSVTEPVQGVNQSVTYTRSDLVGAPVAVHGNSDLFHKLLVVDVDRSDTQNATITAVEYKPEIAAYLEKYHP